MKIDLPKKFLNIFKSNLSIKEMHLHEPTVDKNDSIYLKKCIFRKDYVIQHNYCFMVEHANKARGRVL